ncbi:MAG TPA: hypothetical protein VLC09_03265 [Polyangiaceae bacterium]|nr:hypothetical protein [Polyangiaceae bacterium]
MRPILQLVLPASLSLGSALVGSALLGALACTNGQIGGEIGVDGDGEAAAEGCEERSRTALADDETTALGVSYATLADELRGAHTANLAWAATLRGASASGVSLTPAAGDSDITLDIQPIAGSGAWVDMAVESNDGAEGALIDGSECADELRLRAIVRVTSANGAFDDEFEVELRAASPDLVRGAIALEPGELEGTFAVSADAGRSAVQTTLDFGLVHGSVSGSISGFLESESEGAVSAGGVEYGHFPLEACADGVGYVVDPSSDFGERVLALLEGTRELTLDWRDGSETTAFHFDAQAAGPLCYGGLVGPSRLVVPMTASAQSDDGRVDGTWSLEGQVELDATGQPAHGTVLRQAWLASDYAVEDFVAATGIDGVAFDGESRATFSFSLDEDVGGPESGQLSVLATNSEPCMAEEVEPSEGDAGDPSGSPGCAGVDWSELVQATLAPAE